MPNSSADLNLPPPAAARALWITGPNRAEIRSDPLSPPGPGEVCVRTRYTAVSRGTERLVLSGRVPDELAAVMRAPHQGGDFPWPVKYGYCNVGEVVSGAMPAGTPVFCLYPHQDRYVVEASALVEVPAAVPPARAVLAANVETAINAVWDAGVGPGDRIAVVGAGVVGSLVGWICSGIRGCEVALVDTADRSAVASALGCAYTPPDSAPPDCDIVFHASARAEGLATAIALAGIESTIIELSWYGTAPVPAPLGGAFHHRRLLLRSSQVGGIPPNRRPRWDYRRRLALALRLLADPAPDVLIEEEIPFDDLPRALVALCGPEGGPLCHRVVY